MPLGWQVARGGHGLVRDVLRTPLAPRGWREVGSVWSADGNNRSKLITAMSTEGGKGKEAAVTARANYYSSYVIYYYDDESL